MLFAAQKFIELGYKIGGHPVRRLIIRAIDPQTEDIDELFKIPDEILQRIFGERLGMFIPSDSRNRSGYVEFVYGCAVSEIQKIICSWSKINAASGLMVPEPKEEEKAYV